MQLGRLATTNDVASGFSTSEIMSDLNDIILGQSQGFAGVQQTLCQGFSGVNTALLQGFHGVDNAICTLGYQNQTGFNTLSHQLSDCCCKTQASIADLKYANERQTCEIVGAINNGNQRIVDLINANKIEELNRKLSTAENALNQCQNNAYLLSELKPCAKPAYLTCSPYQSAYGLYTNNSCCGCNSGF